MPRSFGSLNVGAVIFPAISGLLLALCFPVLLFNKQIPNMAFFGWFAFIPLLISVYRDSLTEIFGKAFITGLIFSTLSLFWIGNVLHINAGYSWSGAVACLGFVVFVISLYIGLAFVSATKVSRELKIPFFISLPLAWVIFEYFTNFFPLGGFPWINLGYSQYRYIHLIQTADIFGVLGVSFLMLMTNVFLSESLRSWLNGNRTAAVRGVICVVCIALANFGYGALRIRTIDDGAEKGNSIEVAGVPGGVPQQQKWDPEFGGAIIQKYKQFSYEALNKGADLIIWPETALPYFISRNARFVPANVVPELNVPLLTGAMMADPDNNKIQWNSALLIEQGRIKSIYDKMHLVPLGEYVPFEFPFIKHAFAADVDTQKGSGSEIFHLGDTPFGVQICFEDIFPELTRKWVQKGARFIINLSNEAWYAGSSGLPQHKAHPVFRAIENRTAIVRIANMGNSGLIDAAGRWFDNEPSRNFNFYNIIINPSSFSIYSYLGDLPIKVFAVIFLGLFLWSSLKYRLKKTAAFFGLILLASSISAHAHAQSTGRQQNNTSNDYTPYQYYSNGEAVDLSTGSLILSYTDLVLPGKGGMDLKVRRTFGSTKSVQQKEVEIDKSIFTGYESNFTGVSPPTGVDYMAGEDINSNLVCAAFKWGLWGHLEKKDRYSMYMSEHGCGVKDGAYVERFRYQEISEENLPIKLSSARPMGMADRNEDFLERAPHINYEKNVFPLGVIKSNGDNLEWVPPERAWIFSGSKYVGAVVLRNVLPFRTVVVSRGRMPEMIVLMVKEDGSFDAFDKAGRRMGYTGGANHKILDFYSGGQIMDDPMPVADDFLTTCGKAISLSNSPNPYQQWLSEARAELDGISLRYNAASKYNLDRLVLNDTDNYKYVFSRFKKMTLYSKLMGRNVTQQMCQYDDGTTRGCPYRKNAEGEFYEIKCFCGDASGSDEHSSSCCSPEAQQGIFKSKARIENIPHWEISFYRLSEQSDDYDNMIHYSYDGVDLDSFSNYAINMTDTQGRSIRVNYGIDNVITLSAPGGRNWNYHHNGDGLIKSMVDPEGRITLFRYSSGESNLPLVRHWNMRPHDNDMFMEVRYPNGGVMRYEASRGEGDLAHGEILTTEFPDDRNSSMYYQKFITIDRNVNEGVRTRLYKSDGAIYDYLYSNSDNLSENMKGKFPLLVRRELNAGQTNHVVDEYEWAMSGSAINGLKRATTTENGVAYGSLYEYDNFGRVSSYTNEMGNRVDYEYESAANAPDPATADKIRNLVHAMTRTKTRAEGGVDTIRTVFSRTGTDLCSGSAIPPTRVNKIKIYMNGGQEKNIMEYCFDDSGNIVKEKTADDSETRYSYEDGTGLTAIEDLSGRTALSHDDNTGNVIAITDPQGRTITYEYNKANELTRANYPNGSYTAYNYNVRYNSGGTNSSNSISTDTFDSARDKHHVVTNYFDGMDRLYAVSKGNGNTVYEYGYNKRVSSITYPGNKRYSFNYDGLERVTSILFPGGKEIKYDYNATTLNGRFAHKLDISLNGNLYSTAYRDAAAKVIMSTQYPGNGSAPATTRYQFDEFENLIGITTPEGLTTKNIFDEHGRLKGRIYPDGDRIDLNNIANERGLLDSMVLRDSANGTVTAMFNFDGSDRVTQIDYPELGGVNRNDYNIEYSNDHVAAITAANGRTEFRYTPDGSLSSILQDIPGTVLSDSIGFGEDGFGSTYWIQYPDGTRVFYITDNMGRVSDVRMGSTDGRRIAKMEYDSIGNLETITFGNGVINSYSYDPSGKVKEVRINRNGNVLNQMSYDYDDWGNKSSTTYLDGSRVNFAYDGMHRLIRASYFRPGKNEPYNVQSYSYDGDGNRTAYDDSYKRVRYQYDRGQLVRAGMGEALERRYSYDIRGNMIEDLENKKGAEEFRKNYKYDFQDRLIEAEVKDKDGADIKLEYEYDYASRRVAKKVNGRPERLYIYGKSADPLAELNGQGEVERIFIYAGGRRMAALDDEQFNYYQIDEMGNVLHTTDDKGNVVETLRYDPFGNVNFRVGLAENRYQFASKEYDSETGLIYFGARYYDPESGRFITRDPMEQGINHYAFAKNNPLTNEEYMGTGDVVRSIVNVVVGAVVGVVVGVVTGNPLAGVYAGVATTASMFGQQYSSGNDGSFTVGLTFTGSAPGVGRGGGSIGFNIGPSVSSENGSPAAGGGSGNAGCSQYRICFSIDGDGVSATGGGGNLTGGGSRYGSFGGSGGGGSGLGGGGGFGGGSGYYSGPSLVVDAYFNNEPSYSPINQNPTNNPANYPSYGDVYGGGAAGDAVPAIALTNIGLPVSSPGLETNPIANGRDPFYFANNEPNEFSGRGSPPPPSPSFNLPLNFDQQDDTAISQVQDAMSNISADNTVADPVMLYSGDLLQVETDLKISRRKLDYEFTRTYRSRLYHDGPLGFGWDHNYNKRLVAMSGGETIRRFDGDGRYDDYKLENGRYVSPAGKFDRLVKNSDGTFTIRDRAGIVYSYNSEGFITAIDDRNDNRLSFSYISISGETRLDAVMDSLGRRINYQYDAEARLTSAMDFTNRAVRFVYDGHGDLVAVHSPSVEGFPAGKVTRYTYSSGFDEYSKHLNHNLLTVEGPDGQVYLQNEYSSTDRVEKQIFGNKAFQFSYNRKREFNTCDETKDPALTVSRTTVTDRNGNLTELIFNCQGNPVQMTEFTRGVRPGDPESFVTNYAYNYDGLVTSTTLPEGNRIEYRYEARNTGDPTIDKLFAANRAEIIRVPDAGRGGGDPIVTKYEYEPVYNQARSIEEAGDNGRKTAYYFDYQEGSDFAGIASKMRVPEGIVRTLLQNIPVGQGDLNGDGNTAQIAGDVVRMDSPRVARSDGTESSLNYRFQYNRFGQRTAEIDPKNVRTEYSYSDDGYLIGIVKDAGGLSVTNRYDRDEAGNIVSFTDGNGNRYGFAVNALGQVTAETTPLGYSRRIFYDANNNIARVDEPNVDETGAPIDGNEIITTTFEYNILNRMVARTQEVSGGKNVLTEYQYDDNENLTRIIQPEGNSIAVSYDERDLPYQITKGYGSRDAATVTIGYDKNKNRASIKDGKGKTAAYNYDGYDRLVEFVDPLGNTTEYVYNKVDDLTQITRRGPPNGRVGDSVVLQNVTLAYDAVHRLLSRSEAILDAGSLLGNRLTQYRYNTEGAPSAIIDALGNVTNFTYDNLNRLAQVIDPEGNRLTNEYDANDNVTERTTHEVNAVLGGADAFAKGIIYDALNRPVTLTDNLGHTKQFRYDSRNNLIYSSDSKDSPGLDEGPNSGEGNVVRYRYDGLGRLKEQIQNITLNGAGNGTAAGAVTTYYDWDDNSRLISITDANNNTTRFTYDDLNRRIETEMADGAIYRKKFDRNSNVVETSDPLGFVTELIYDDANRNTRRNIMLRGNPQGYESFEYDGLGRTTLARSYNLSDALSNTVERGYDSLGNILRESQNGLTIADNYDLNGNRRGLIYPSGKTINYDLDRAGKITVIRDALLGTLAQLSWANSSQVGYMRYLNNVSTETRHDGLGRIVRQITESAGGGVVTGYESGYDKAGNRLFDRILNSGDSGNVYSYDNLSRLTGATYGVPSPENSALDPVSAGFSYRESFTYDSVHNWLSRIENLGNLDPAQTIQTSFAANDVNEYANASTSQNGVPIASHSFVYDGNGNMAQDDEHTYIYDYRNYLTEVRSAATGGLIAAYQYDALGRRISKNSSGITTNYIYDGFDVIEERIGETVTAEYTHGTNVDELVSLEKDGETYFYHTDVSGNVVALTNSAGAVVERYTYKTYGGVNIYNASGEPIEQSAVGNHYLYAGRQYDTETGLYYYRLRAYNPEIGRFMQKDPLGYVDGMNQYAYVLNNPVNFIDPFGLSRVGDSSGQNSYLGMLTDNPVYGPANFQTGNQFIDPAIGLLNDVVNLVDNTFYGALGAIGRATAYAEEKTGVNFDELYWASQSTPIPLDDVISGSLVGLRSLSNLGRASEQANTLVQAEKFSGVRELSQMLIETGVPRSSRLEIIHSFNVDSIIARTANGGENVLRYYGGEANRIGRFVTPNLPSGWARSELALPPGNTMSNLTQFNLSPGTRYFEGTVAPNFRQPGGGYQYFVPSLKNLLEVTR